MSDCKQGLLVQQRTQLVHSCPKALLATIATCSSTRSPGELQDYALGLSGSEAPPSKARDGLPRTSNHAGISLRIKPSGFVFQKISKSFRVPHQVDQLSCKRVTG